MEFSQLLEAVKAHLKTHRRVSYRRLKREFKLDDEDIADIRDELVDAQQVASDESNKVLVWGAEETIGDGGNIRSPQHLSERILSQRSSMEGELKQVTVMFCDIANSVSLATLAGAERWHNIMNDVFGVLTRIVHDMEGTVNQYTGDGVMAIFGAPLSVEEHAVKACMAAQHICREMISVSEKIQQEHGFAVEIRVGLNSGEIVVGRIGDDLRMDYTAQGQVIGLASRMESKARHGHALLTENTAREVQGRCELLPQAPVSVKGVTEPMPVFELGEVRSDSNRFSTSFQRGLTQFVAREAEMATLEQALQQAKSGSGQIVGIVADAGTGKSRLCHEFLDSCRARGMSVLQGHAAAHNQQTPLVPMLQVFRSYYGITAEHNAAEARAIIAKRLSGFGLEFAKVIPLVYELLGVTEAETPRLQMDPDAKQRQLFSLLRLAIQGGDPNMGNIVTWIDDIHWLDAASAEFLEQWVDAVADSESLLILSFRPEYSSDWLERPYYQQLDLAPLGMSAVKTMLSDLIGEHPSTVGLADLIFQRTAGNPLFCEEMVRSLRESGQLTPVNAGFALLTSLPKLTMPASVQALLASRIDKLTAKDKELLQIAAIIGREFTQLLLFACTDQPADDLLASLNELQKNAFIEPIESGANSFLQFRHALIQEVAAHSLLKQKRNDTHGRIAKAIETFYPNQQDAKAANHWEHADEPLLAAKAWQRAAAQIAGSNRNEQMLCLRSVLRLTEALPMSEAKLGLRLQALGELIAAGGWRFNMSDDELTTMATEAVELAEAAKLHDMAMLIRSGHSASLGMMRGDVQAWGKSIDLLVGNMQGVSPETEGAILGNYSYSLYARGQLETALRHARRGWEMAGDDASFGQASGFSVLVTCLNNGVTAYSAAGSPDEALNCNNRGLQVAESNQLTEELIWHKANRSEIISIGDYSPTDPAVREAAIHAEKALEMAEQRASDFTRAVAYRGYAISRMLLQDYPAAEQAVVKCLVHCRERQAHLEVEARCLALLSGAQYRQGKSNEAIE